jgi:hypothetical protein
MRYLTAILGFCLLAAAAPRAAAQLEVTLSIPRDTFVSLEAIEATVTIKNDVGKDVVLGGKGGNSWLNFQIHDTAGIAVSPIRVPIVQPMVLRQGQSLQRKFQLERHFFLSDSGTYVIRAAAWFPDLEKHVYSRPGRFTVQQPRTPRWQEVFAVPGQRGYRRFQVFTFDDTTKSYVCLSVVDEETKMVMSRTALGSVLTDKEVQPALDDRKNLHLIYRSTPTLFVYQQIDPSGRISDLKYFLASKGTPKLIKNFDNTVSIVGGTLFDPNAPPKPDPFRKLSDRPVALPD